MLFVGQAGIQIGHHLLAYQAQQLGNNHRGAFVAVDAEPKVVASIGREFLPPPETVSVGPPVAQLISDVPGSGKNWAAGYANRHLVEKAIEATRKLLEQTPCCHELLMVHSLGGGTGSGAGSAILEGVREMAPETGIVNAAVFPFSADGLTTVYNATLSLSWLRQFSDAVILWQNDQLMSDCAADGPTPPRATATLISTGTSGATPRKPGPAVSPSPGVARRPPLAAAASPGVLQRMNTMVSCALGRVIFPLGQSRAADGLWDLITDVVPDPSMKYLEMVSRPVCPDPSWEQATRRFLASLPRFSVDQTPGGPPPPGQARWGEDGRPVWIEPGDGDLGYAPPVVTSRSCAETMIGEGPMLTLAANISCPFRVELQGPQCHLPHTRRQHLPTTRICPIVCASAGPTMTLAANTSTTSALATRLGRRAVRLFQSRAYFHWYERYGLEADTFADCLEELRAIAEIAPVVAAPTPSSGSTPVT
ncbi:putative zeta tubulin L homeolog [Paratrimastix pyriformis]|uniref:Tubulin delta chain n=1 Tax=Paratrimastix pyriformis TaxID=342808 RepID=A0ABQ8ULB4_9EUKA|nr:putative zeta tubulin L homeolog [Paratrimastix pyriformis]